MRASSSTSDHGSSRRATASWYSDKSAIVADARAMLEERAKRVGPSGDRCVQREPALLDEPQRAGRDQSLGEAPPRHDGGRGPVSQATFAVDDRAEAGHEVGAKKQVVAPPL